MESKRTQCWKTNDKITQPSGAATPEETDTRHRRASAFFGYSFGGNSTGSSGPCCGRGRKVPRVSACEPPCAILLRKPSVYPLSPVKANVGRLCEKLKIGMRSGWGQRCNGNFLAIFAGTLLDEKPNFTGRFFEWRRPFENITR